MIPTGPDSKAILSINVTFFGAAVFGVIAWWLWPETVEGWRAGLLAILCGYGALISTIAGVGKLRQHLTHDIGVDKFERRARPPRSDTLADEESLRKAGMIE